MPVSRSPTQARTSCTAPPTNSLGLIARGGPDHRSPHSLRADRQSAAKLTTSHCRCASRVGVRSLCEGKTDQTLGSPLISHDRRANAVARIQSVCKEENDQTL